MPRTLPSGKVYAVQCPTCNVAKIRKHYGDAIGWQKQHTEEHKPVIKVIHDVRAELGRPPRPRRQSTPRT